MFLSLGKKAWGRGRKSIAFRKVNFHNLTDMAIEVSWNGCLKERNKENRNL